MVTSTDKSVGPKPSDPDAAPKAGLCLGPRLLPCDAVPSPGPCPHPGQLVPLFFVLHLFLHFVDPLQRLQAFIEQKCCVVYQHVYIADKLLPGTKKAITRYMVTHFPGAEVQLWCCSPTSPETLLFFCIN